MRDRGLAAVHARGLVRLCVLAALGLGCLAGCHPAGGKSSPASLLVFAAASTANALDAVLAHYRELRPVEVTVSYGASSTLAQQIAHGAAANLFLSADEDWVRFLAQKKLVSQSRLLLSNSLVVVVARGGNLNLHQLEDLAGNQVTKIALADPRHVPAGKYARHALESLGLWNKLAPKVVSGSDVRAALAYVETGAADAGIVYASDAQQSKHARVAFAIPEALSGKIRYVLALLKQGPVPDSQELYKYLASPEAAALFARYGFDVSETLNVATH
jgi:molybdate transport system substrate-binding protein